MNTPLASSTEIDDIMSSIRDSVAAEGPKVGTNADLLEAAAVADADPESSPDASDDDVLELTPAELTAPAAQPEVAKAAPPVDVQDILGVATLAPEDSAADEFDKLLAEIGQEKQQRAAAVEAQKEALLAEIEPLGSPEPEPVTTVAPAEALNAEAFNPAPPAAAAIETAPATPVVPTSTHTVGTIETASGMQLVLPTEVLAVALRPMVQGWLEANLPKVVEQLVQAEIAKLNQN